MVFSVDKYKHSFGFRPKLYLNPSVLKWSVKFDRTFAFDPKEITDSSFTDYDKLRMYEQINKLIGVGHFHHHGYSARFGFKPRKDHIQLWAYSYVDGQRDERYLADVLVDKYFKCQIEIAKNGWKYKVVVDDVATTYELKANLSWRRLISYRLNPYFGGVVPSPYNMSIVIQNL